MLLMENEHESVNPQHEQNANEDAALQNAGIDSALLKSLEWRSIGPFRGGRVVAVAGDPSDAQGFYFCSTGGGVLKERAGGLDLGKASDVLFMLGSLGFIALSGSDFV